jgi:hypothetical protein
MSPSPEETPETRFWTWFTKNEDMLFDFENNQGQNISSLLCELHRIHESLTFEIGSETNGIREFIISADGNRSAFPNVIALADAAPSLRRWTVTKFRPRRTEPCLIGIGDLQFTSEDVLASLQPEGTRIGITVYLGDTHHFDENIVGHIGFILLDYALGEYDVETLVGTVSFFPRERVSRLKKLSLRELPSAFDQLAQSLVN